MAHNKFSDWHDFEYKQLLRSNSPNQMNSSPETSSSEGRPIVEGMIDWRDTTAVGPIKNQGSCGSCWAFATAAVLEAAHVFQTGEYVTLSEQ